MKRILITGGSGLIGTEVLHQLPQGTEIYAVGRRSKEELAGSVTAAINIDLSRPFDVKMLPSEIDAIIHLAQSENYKNFPEEAPDVFGVNTAATATLLDYARKAGCKKFVYASAGRPYGRDAKAFLDNAPDPTRGEVSFYLATKVASEILASSYAGIFTVLILRFFFVYGPGQRPSMLIPRLIESVQMKRPITLAGSQGIILTPTYVTDAARAVCRALELQESVKLDVAGPEKLSLREVSETIGHAIGKEPNFIVREDIEAADLSADTKRMADLLGSPLTKFKEGVGRLLASRES